MSSKPAARVIKAETMEEIAECMKIRYDVFVTEQGYSPDIEKDDPEDPVSTHFLAYVDDKPVGTIRLNNDKNKLGRFAILKEYRGCGYGQPLVNALHEHVSSRGGKEVWCEVQADVRPGGFDARRFYWRLGYQNRGDLWAKLGSQHQNMFYDLTAKARVGT